MLSVIGGVGLAGYLASCGAMGTPFPEDHTVSHYSIVNPLPGAKPFGTALVDSLEQAWRSRSADYQPRTQHLHPDRSPKYINRLFLEVSPYLLQHAHNPMNWYPWGDDAFKEARRLGRPVLLSVGYSTCHWCHVMEEESFDDDEIARFINKNYIAIKVDREERPDIDAVYMSAVQALSGRGGWPMTVWLTADRKPFYARTYIPARDGDRGTPMGFLTLLGKLRTAYDEVPEKIEARAIQIIAAMQRSLEPQTEESVPGSDALHNLMDYFREHFDEVHGGRRGAPKFPSSLPIRALLRYHRRTGDQQALKMAESTLEKMAEGGIYDQIGGGFHRYSTDERWLVPHFEKMLYDNALLVKAYLEGFQVTGREQFAAVARDILRYVGREMTSPKGAFYSATDADSLNRKGHREEGWFFTWTREEIRNILSGDEADAVLAYYAITEKGNFEGRNILSRPRGDLEIASNLKVSVAQLRSRIDAARAVLYRVRASRPRPFLDEKILTSWNSLMISAYARAALVLGDDEYAMRASRAADFLWSNLRRDGRLLRSYRDGRVSHNAFLDDYVFFIAALLDLYEATGNSVRLYQVLELQETVELHYEDPEKGGFFMTSNDHERLLVREKPNYDGAEPSGNSVAAMNLMRIHELTGDDRYRRKAESVFRAFSKTIARAPAALPEMLLALDFYLDRVKQVLIVTPNSRTQAEPFLAELRRRFVPNCILSVVTTSELPTHVDVVPLLRGKRVLKGKTTAYVCEQKACELPTVTPEVFAAQIMRVEPLPRNVNH